MKPRISVVIPTHEMEGREFFLRRNLDALWNQTIQDFEIVVTDNSDDDLIESICTYYGSIKYIRNPRKGMAQNTNEGIKNSTGELIKFIYLDDYLAHDRALERIYAGFDPKAGWLVTACEHADKYGLHNIHHPKYTKDVAKGINTIGSPSVLTINNHKPLLFDEEMTWLLDCDYYYRLHERYQRPPTILTDVNVVIGIHDGQATNLLSDELKMKEHEYINTKHE